MIDWLGIGMAFLFIRKIDIGINKYDIRERKTFIAICNCYDYDNDFDENDDDIDAIQVDAHLGYLFIRVYL